MHNEQRLKIDLDEFGRQLRLKEYFYDEDDEYVSHHLVKNKSEFVPPDKRDSHLDNFIDSLNGMSVKQVDNRIRSNLNQSEKEALNLLKSRKDIVIKEADKGSAVVILNSGFYQEKLMNMLSDTETYSTLSSNQDLKILHRVEKLVKSSNNEVTDKERQFLTKFDHKTSRFYGLPKVHKSQIIKDAIKEQNMEYIKVPDPQDLSFRPVVAGPAAVTSRLSNLIDILLRPFIPYVKSYVRDDIDMLNHLPATIGEDEILLSLDAASLYTNIDHDLAIEAITYWLDRHPEDIHERFSKDFIIESIKLVLKNNTFTFNGMDFLQMRGTAMGTKMAPTLCTLVLGYLETKLYSKIEQIYGLEIRNRVEKNFKRYLDDVFMILNIKDIAENDFIAMLNDLHSKIRFSGNSSRKSIPFLDILVIIQGNKIQTDLYRKPTDSQSYLDYKSCHPRSTKNNIPYSLARRICCIVSEKENQEKHLAELKHILLARNYPEGVIDKGVEMAKKLSLRELRQPKTRITSETLALVVDFCPSSPNVFNQVKSNFEVLKQSPLMKNVLKDTVLIKSNRQGPSLKKLLTRAKFEPEEEAKIGAYPCNTQRCKCCPEIETTQEVDFHKVNESFAIRNYFTCKSKNLIYKLTCLGCNEYYIGQTGDYLNNRMTGHRYGIKNDCALGVDRHIFQCASNLTHKYTIIPFYKVRENNRFVREAHEKFFIEKFEPSLNRLLPF